MPESRSFASYFGGIGRALSAPDYRTYWYSHVVSSHGVWIYRMAVGVLIFQLTHSPAWLGFIAFVYSVPLMILGPIAGAVGDRFGVRRTAITGLAIGALVCFLMTYLTFAGLITPLVLSVHVVLLGAMHAFDFPARMALIPQMVGRERISAAVALNSTTFNTSSFTGPMIGAALLAFGKVHLGDAAPAVAFLAYAVSMVWLLTAILRIKIRDAPSVGGTFATLMADIRGGISYTFRHKGIRQSLIFYFCVSFLVKSYLDLLPGYALDIFDRGETGLGTLMSASGLGALFLSVAVALRGRTQGTTLIMIAASLVASIALALFTLTGDFLLATAIIAIVGGFLVAANICSQTLVQNATDGVYRGRVVSIYLALIVGAQALGAQTLGLIAEFTGFRISMGGAAVLALILVVAMVPSLWRQRLVMEAEDAGG
ncbi:MAG: MFS transporter [Rhodospirillales bacterium]|jgi:predicted MFS family arabinose efflux permease|nr:MFS transporter [Rhodospirillales bacterium]MDP6645970.1 MFS transporter [Rhodospirillales bacterium]MDP6842890.1 MFS transporter [Rhodospirillales bacterium]|tara:strand:- start:1503 stop:2786 length:1284 start_codon:yes stop_codon:yes gene_type:complete